MKQIDKMSRLTGELEKAFRLLNQDYFDGVLDMPIITVIPTSKAYAHYTPYQIWDTKDGRKHEVNISSASLDRPLENIISSLLHEMVHMYNDTILNVQDTSRCGTYHNKLFKLSAESHGLTVSRSEKYGFAHTSPTESLIDWIIDHDELREIEMYRLSASTPSGSIGTHSSNGNETAKPTGINPSSHSRKYICPCCNNSVRATKQVNIICGDCMSRMIVV